ncbi:hypothetical protein ACG83_33795 [Frankia sp. R43]|uniref:DMT family transporter n=1 Tax=Frankia sp. R43 TaxID=269536 RepID=UPI0006CA08B2|nr:DMT family transporter [Frankia sp. R43]KPM51781.1 hypothetical protein ACG83_33795 [Frankia sp. R43]
MLMTYLLGLGSAVCFGVAAVIQQRVAFHAPPEDVLRLRLLLWLVRRPLWDAGVLLSAVGTFAAAAALARSTVAFVAPLQVCQLLFALPLAAVWARRRVPRRDWAAAIATALGLGTFLFAGDPHQGEVEAATTVGWLLTGLSIGGLATWAVLGTRRLDPARRATMLAGGAGLLSALQSALVSGVGRRVETSGVGSIFGSWELYAVVVVALTSGLLLQSAYEMAPLPASLPAAVTLEPLGGVAIGVFLLGGMLRVSPLAVVGEIAGLAIMIVGVRVLASSPLVTGQMSRLRARTSQGQLSRLEDLLHRDLEVLRDDLARGRRASTDRAQRRQYRRLHHDLDRIHCELARLVDDRDHLDARINTMRAASVGIGAGRRAPGTTAAADTRIAGGTAPGSTAGGTAAGALRSVTSSSRNGTNGQVPRSTTSRRPTAGRPSTRVPHGTGPGLGPVPPPGAGTGPVPMPTPVPAGSVSSLPPAGRSRARGGDDERTRARARNGDGRARDHTPGHPAPGHPAGPDHRANGHRDGDDHADVISDHELAASQRALDARADALLAQAEVLSAKAETMLRSLAS